MDSSNCLPIARGYCRVSTIMQVDEGISLETQQKRILDYCLYKGLHCEKIYVDSGISGKDTRRPQLQQLLSDMNRDEYIIVSDLSRLSRSTRDSLDMFERFKVKGVKFICLQPDIDFSTPVGELIFTILMAVHKLERENISKHVSVNMQRLSREGKLRTRAPFGYKFMGKDHDMEPDPEQQAVLEKIKQLYFSGMNYSQIANKLNEDGDNQCLSNNKRQSDKIYQFHGSTVRLILIDHDIVQPKKGINRMSLEQRIKCHYNRDIQDIN